MEGLSMQQEHDGKMERGYEALKTEARAEVDEELARRMAGYESYDTDALVSELHDMLAEYAAVVPGTREPVNNDYRYHAEYVQTLLLERGENNPTAVYLAQTAPQGYKVKANPAAYQVANDNRSQLRVAV
jgi:hypothetical protein